MLVLICTICTGAAKSQPTATLADTLHVNMFDDAESKPGNAAYGITGGFAHDLFHSNFKYLPGVLACSPTTTSGTGSFTSGSLYYSIQPFSNRTFLQFALGYAGISGLMSTDEYTTVAVAGNPTQSTIAHMIDVSLNRLIFTPSIGYKLFSAFSLTLGSELGLLLSPHYAYSETLRTPSGAVFVDTKSSTRNLQSGDLPQAKRLQSAIVAGVRYELSANRIAANLPSTMSLIPWVGYKYGLTDLVQGLSWRENGLAASISFEYRPAVHSTFVPAPAHSIVTTDRPARTEPAPFLHASIHAEMLTLAHAGESDTPQKSQTNAIEVREVVERLLVPTVPYVFFSANSAELPERYIRRTELELHRLKKSADRLALYRDLLNTVGERMARHPTAKISLIGCSDPELAPEVSKDLAKQRAETVRDYLVKNWQVSPGRIEIHARVAPVHPSPPTNPDGAEENRRVEITSLDPKVLEPVFTFDSARVVTLPTLRFYPKITSAVGVASWEVNVSQNGQNLHAWHGESVGPPDRLEWRAPVANTQNGASNEGGLVSGVIDAQLVAKDLTGQKVIASDQVSIEEHVERTERDREARADSVELERYTLLLFDFNSSDIASGNEGNRKMLELIKQRIAASSDSITIEGFSDRIGETEANRKLADERARSAAIALGLPYSVIIPSDGRPARYSNDLPEGRIYSRTVEISLQHRSQ